MKNFSDTKAYLNFRKRMRRFDPVLIITLLCLAILGLVVLSSATKSYGTGYHVKRQMVATAIGIVAMVVLMLIDYRIWKKLYIPIYLLCILLLAATLVFGHGEDMWGSRSWLRLGPINFQPSEFVKIGLIIALSARLEIEGDINRLWPFLRTMVFAGIPVLLILRQPDAGTAMVFVFFIAVMLFFHGLSWKIIFGAIGATIVTLPVVYLFLEDYQKKRILGFIDPSSDISGSGYQYYEGRMAIGSGRFLGKGLYHGSQTQYNFIPTKETDSIFAVLVEELGFVGGFSLLFLYALMLYRILEISRQAKDDMGKTLTAGTAAMLLFHIWENVGMNLGVMPITGIPLPLVSYGGTFQILVFASIGLCLSVRFHRDRSPA